MICLLSKDLIAGVIGESGSIIGTLAPVALSQAEEQGVKFGAALNAANLAALRAIPAQQLLEASCKQGMPRFSTVQDGHFFPERPQALIAAGKQAHVPLLAGWNSEESGPRGVLGDDPPTNENFEKAVRQLYPEDADAVLKEYAPKSDDEVLQAATDLAGGVIRNSGSTPPPPPARGAVHSAEIEYAMGNLKTNTVYEWTPDDFKVSEAMQAYFANFVKTGNPNGKGLLKWPAVNEGSSVQYLRIDVQPKVETEQHRGRYLLMDRLATKR